MTQEELDEILRLRQRKKDELKEVLRQHKAWLVGQYEGEYADFHGGDLSGEDFSDEDIRGVDFHDANLYNVNFRFTDLYHTNLNRADMRRADIDYASWPLSGGSLEAYVDDRIAIQLLYHTLSVVQHSPYVSEEVKAKRLTPEIVSLANRFHLVRGFGKIKEWEDEDK